MVSASRSRPLQVFWTAGKELAYWAPVWIPLGLFAQIALLGLRPALVEHERLEHEAAGVEARHERTEEEWKRMRAEREAWDDEIWRERMRRAHLEESSGSKARAKD